jgi:hypothetical protein
MAAIDETGAAAVGCFNLLLELVLVIASVEGSLNCGAVTVVVVVVAVDGGDDGD